MEDLKSWVIVANRKFPSVIFSIEFANYHLNVVTGVGLHVIEYSTSAYFIKHGLVPSEAGNEELSRQLSKSPRGAGEGEDLEES